MKDKQGNTTKTTRVIIMDSNPDIRTRTRDLLMQDTNVEIVAEAANVIEMLAKVNLAQPDAILVNLDVGGGGCMGILKEIKANHPDIHIIAVGVNDSYQYYLEISGKEGSSQMVKVDSPLAFLISLNTIISPETSSPRPVTSIGYNDLTMNLSLKVDSEKVHLTPREEQVLRLLADGKTNIEISKILSLRPSTVRTHRALLMAKLRLPDRTDLMKRALMNGMIKLNLTDK